MIPDECKPELFRPSTTNPSVCRWWMMPPKTIETLWLPFCCHSLRMGSKCPTEGMNPYPTEEDGYQDYVDSGD
jgi:hypothetical protein